ncbi:hypothetical protein [Bradyrhizobium sp. STM 3809]|uniref:hypothetical protein n=1 Tax=Bradyrhizobium sp. STM 3809 TaxID=551936 RepID=UPI0014782BD3|nr:hypothetical protein [Bradyrhizobium sp. STM 3809]
MGAEAPVASKEGATVITDVADLARDRGQAGEAWRICLWEKSRTRRRKERARINPELRLIATQLVSENAPLRKRIRSRQWQAEWQELHLPLPSLSQRAF